MTEVRLTSHFSFLFVSHKFKSNRNLSGSITSFKFNGKKYKLDYGINEVKGNSFPLQCNVTYLQQYFGANIRYDYEKELIYIDF